MPRTGPTEEELLEVFLRGKNNFPRHVGAHNVLWRNVIYSWSEFLFWFSNHRLGNFYTSVFSTKQMDRSIYDVLFFETYDFDPRVVEYAYVVAQKIGKLLDDAGIRYVVYFTGGRSFHFYVRFKPVALSSYRRVVEKFLITYNISKYIDVQVGTSSQMARVPLTVNSRTGLYMVPINLSWPFSTVIRASKRGLFFVPSFEENSDLHNELLKFDKQSNGFEGGSAWVPRFDVDEVPLCVLNAYKELKRTGELDHMMRVVMTEYFIQIGLPKDTIFAIFRDFANDFNPRLTKYQIDYLSRHAYSYSCRRIRSAGYCPYEDMSLCAFYPNMFRKLEEV